MTMPIIALIATALVLAIVMVIMAIDIRMIFERLTLFRRMIGGYPAPLRRLFWRQFAWIGFPYTQLVSLIFWLLIAFPTACQLARLAMSPA
ncbi:hypothetical protein [Sphingobium yanoikuyae]|uniref:Uncharacterized protein n=1 Tax=Sphingobium yanoikuyae TaxID=13690 RepID=A0A291MWJ9_SPHYA|nr:hypothetical protein [Sphingobium yanoikuyae]ATI79462.1 hypothetical protein A6768_05110 [Sphingobium yanoikuyae]